jgi:hypothetical protein
LGHFKKFAGFEREKAPFVFTPQYAHILGNKGSPMYSLFEETCSKAYNIVRRNSDLFINLFSMVRNKKKKKNIINVIDALSWTSRTSKCGRYSILTRSIGS